MPTTPKGTKRGPVGAYRGEFRIAEKRCAKCDTTKPLDSFRISRYTTAAGNQSVRISTHCLECQRIRKLAYHRANKAKFVAKAKAWNEAHPEEYRRNNQKIQLKKRLKRFGLTVEDYRRLVESQGGKCAICKQPPPPHHCRKHDGENLLSIDHDHKTGRVRGLLCRRCNLALGNILDSEAVAIGLLEYIRTRC